MALFIHDSYILRIRQMRIVNRLDTEIKDRHLSLGQSVFDPMFLPREIQRGTPTPAQSLELPNRDMCLSTVGDRGMSISVVFASMVYGHRQSTAHTSAVCNSVTIALWGFFYPSQTTARHTSHELGRCPCFSMQYFGGLYQ